MVNLEGKVAIVTGGGRGLGRVEALQLAELGAAVVINEWGGTAQSRACAREVVEEIERRGGRATEVFGDCAGEDTAASLLRTALDRYGDLHILVNNAGFCRDRMLFNLPQEDFDAVVRVHLRGHFVNMQAACRYWREKSKAEGAPVYGRLISTASESFMIAPPTQPNYAAAKAGIVALTGAAAKTMAKYGVTANSICPRARTDMTGHSATFAAPEDGGFDTYAPEHVAPLVGYLASPAAAHLSDQVFVVWGRQISLVEPARIGREFAAECAWTPDSVAAQLADCVANLQTA